MTEPASFVRPEATTWSVYDILRRAEGGQLFVPAFQRSFRWDPDDVRRLFDSIYRGYPIGELLLWETEPSLGATTNFGPVRFSRAMGRGFVIIDGQQRVTSLAAVLLRRAPQDPALSPRDASLFRLFFDLEQGRFVHAGAPELPDTWLPLPEVAETLRFVQWLQGRSLPDKLIQTANQLFRALRDYRMPVYVVHTQDEQQIREIFERTNTAGKRLRSQEIFDALQTGHRELDRVNTLAYDDIFERATGRAPYPYQRRLALTDDLPAALGAPTGAGKTAAVALAWLYRRRFAAEAVRRATPRRLVFCLPMRTLVSQTAEAISTWLRRLTLLDEGAGLDRAGGVGVHVLMGGEVDRDWHLHPERDAVLVGTEDMLLSRALNRGYGLSRFRWPWHYALLNNDCLWVFDEVQLLGAGLATGLQLAAFRERFESFGPAHSLFMSATMEPGWLETVDHPAPSSVVTLSSEDLAAAALSRRRQAPKALSRAKTVLARGDKGAGGKLADEILARHVPGSRTVVVLNTVDRAREVFEALGRRAGKKGAAAVLLHSRFRPPDRESALRRALAADFEGIVVSTQVIEAGVDLSSRTLFTELAPWASIVQRVGRCNRGGEYDDATVSWVDHDELDERSAAPYDPADLQISRGHLAALASVNPEAIAQAGVVMRLKPPAQVLRRRDAIDLFDTTADLGGADLDVSRFIRDGDERDAQVFWRDVLDAPTSEEPRPDRAELCSVPFLSLRDWLREPRRAFRWDALGGAFRSVRAQEIVPGAVYLLRARDGGYDSSLGWDGVSAPTSVVAAPVPAGQPDREEAMGEDPLSELPGWVTLAAHAADARRAAEEICSALDFLPPALVSTVVRAARAHDLGKAHEVFQRTMRSWYTGTDPGPFAKSGGRARHARAGFRHELASALAWLAHGGGDDRDLVAYLLAAHHGKVRLSLRALPGDAAPPELEKLHARGIWDGDRLPAVDLGDGVVVPETELSLTPMLMGRHGDAPSWVERVIALRERYGPFRLAYLEALVCAADVRASMWEREAAS